MRVPTTYLHIHLCLGSIVLVAFSCPFLGFLSIIGNMKMDALKFWHSKLCFCELKKISRQQYFLDFGKLGGCFQILTLNNPEWIWDPVQPDIYNAWNLISSFDLKLANLKRFQTLKSIQVNNYEIVVNFFHISHNLTWYSAIVHKFTRINPVCSTYELTKQFM